MTNKTGFFKRLKALSFQQKKLFATALCQRMYPNYQLFAEVCEFGDTKMLATCLELCWQALYDTKLKFNIETYLDKLDANTPDPHDFIVYGVYPAMDAAVALTALLSAIDAKQEDELVNISKLSSATVAHYIEATLDQEMNDEALSDYIYAHEAMLAEQDYQLALLEKIESQAQFSADWIKLLRKEIVAKGISNIGISASAD